MFELEPRPEITGVAAAKGPRTRAERASRGVIVLGMHRSGTSLTARGLAALGVDLGDRLAKPRPDNPTGFWEDRSFVWLNERLLSALGTAWPRAELVAGEAWAAPRVARLWSVAERYLETEWLGRALWGFKDPRTVRLLPFWRSLMQAGGCDDAYVVAIRNPLSVARSLFARQAMAPAAAHRLWLAYMCQHLECIEGRPFVVVDYDLLTDSPEAQLRRVGAALQLEPPAAGEVRGFATRFVRTGLRHSRFSAEEAETGAGAGQLTHQAYLALRELATDAGDAAAFWARWREIRQAALELLREPTARASRNRLPAAAAFVGSSGEPRPGPQALARGLAAELLPRLTPHGGWFAPTPLTAHRPALSGAFRRAP